MSWNGKPFIALLAAVLAITLPSCSPDPAHGESKGGVNFHTEPSSLAMEVPIQSGREAYQDVSSPPAAETGREATPPARPPSAREPFPAGENGIIETTNNESGVSSVSADGMIAVNITIGGEVFSARFHDNETSRAFLALTPLTLDMSDLNRNEKMAYLPEDLPTASTERPPEILAGEIKLYYKNCVVLFYHSFSNSYGGYTSLGYVEDPSGLAAALGSGNAVIAFDTV